MAGQVRTQLSEGCLENIIARGEQPEPIRLQVLGWQPLKDKTKDSETAAPARFRLVVSDGVHSTNLCIINAQLAGPKGGNEFDGEPVLEIRKLHRATNTPRPIIVITEFSKLSSNDGGRIGNPQQLPAHLIPNIGGGGTAPLLQQNGHQRSGDNNHITGDDMSGVGLIKENGAARPNQTSGGGVAAAAAGCYPISALTPYQNKWKIRAKVMKKGEIRTFHNARGEGKVFSADLVDESGEIRCSGFNQQVDAFYHMMQQDGCYYISGGTIKPANKQFSSLKNDYELQFSQNTTVEPCYENTPSIPMYTFNFVKFDRLSTQPKDRLIDVIGVVKTASPVTDLTSRAGKALKKRDITLVDDTDHSVNLTLWGKEAEDFGTDGDMNPVLTVKGAKVSDFGGVSLSTVFSSVMNKNPNIGQAHSLKGWWMDKGCNQTNVNQLSSSRGGDGGGKPFKTIGEAEAEDLGKGEKPDYFSVTAHISFVKGQDCLYKGCASEGCKKKVTDMGNGSYRCEKCNQEFTTFKYNLMLPFEIKDFTGTKWISIFGDNGQALLGKTSEELGHLKDNNEQEFERVLNSIVFKTFTFRIGARVENFNDQVRVKWNCYRITPMGPLSSIDQQMTNLKELVERYHLE